MINYIELFNQHRTGDQCILVGLAVVDVEVEHQHTATRHQADAAITQRADA
jgi:hypothetical protein